ncbi:universal stress protein [Natrarchaeobaculum aegyptiacum]|uniref:UspA domain-containing protein n=1 Tax=Natrarchaeobaculum aegyptiacum TaxID=745377 RepID=A0A2Z2HUY4_9EURY|nr:universal stress protein [Natrarchaeobaculum aegyptiacum]ARS91000.1 hypothetical protein B1756_15510 [Natrarchaeobaculum aegyptiacum]
MSPDAADDVESILVPIDGSDAATAALETALSLAETAGASVHVLAVVDVESGPLRFDTDFVTDLEDARRRLLEEVRSEYGDRTVPVTGSIRRGVPARAILREASERDVDLIVLGRSGATGIVAPLLGSTTARVLRRATVPVLVAPGEDESGTDASNSRTPSRSGGVGPGVDPSTDP